MRAPTLVATFHLFTRIVAATVEALVVGLSAAHSVALLSVLIF